MNKEQSMSIMYENMMKYVVNYDKKEEDNFKVRQFQLPHFLSSYLIYTKGMNDMTDAEAEKINQANYDILFAVDSNSAETVELKQNVDKTLSLVL